MTILGVVFLLSSSAGTYATAGAVSSAYALAYAFASPLTSRLADRHRGRRVLACTAVANTVCRAGFLLAAWTGAPPWTLFAVSALSGATMPSIGSLVRARWGRLLRGSPLLHTALSLHSVLDELVFVAGPIAVSVLAVSVAPGAGLLLALVLSCAGQIGLSLQPDPGEPGCPAPEQVGARAGGSPLSRLGLIPLVLGFVAFGAAQSTVELTTVAFCHHHGAKLLAGWILALLALSSAAVGFWYGSRRWRVPPSRLLAVASFLFCAGTVLFVAAQAVWFLPVAVLALGATLAPMMIAGVSLVHARVPDGELAEGLTWLTTAMGLGIGLGAVTAGRLVDAFGTSAAFTAATGCAAVNAAACALVHLQARHRPGEGTPA